MEGGIPEAAPRVPPSTSPHSACTEGSARKKSARRAGDCCRQTAATTWAPPRRLRSILLPRPNPISLLTGYGRAEQSSFTLGCFFFWLYLVMFSGQTPVPHPIKEPLASTGPWLGTQLCSQTKQHPQGFLGCTHGWGGPWGAEQEVPTCCGFSVRFWASLLRSVTAAGMRGHGTGGAHQVPVELTRSQWLELHAAHSHHRITSPWPPPHTRHPCSHAVIKRRGQAQSCVSDSPSSVERKKGRTGPWGWGIAQEGPEHPKVKKDSTGAPDTPDRSGKMLISQ